MFPVVIKSMNQDFDEIKSFGAGECGRVIIERLRNKLLNESWKLRMNKAVDIHLEKMRGQNIIH
ncbi:MAG: hypothetical protein ACUVWV_12185 [Thermodesulfobacteriota bacterium]